MKKIIVLLTLSMSLVALTSCKDSKAQPEKESTTEVKGGNGAEKADLAMNAEYQCPMDCEDGKTYDKEGACPVCKMDLKKLKSMDSDKHEHENGEVHDNHDSDDDHE